MSEEHIGLEQIIANRIAAEGPISFRDYMDMCLYYPGIGYYTSSEDRIGFSGDYYTSPQLTPAFAYAVVCQIEKYGNYWVKAPLPLWSLVLVMVYYARIFSTN